MKKVTAPATSIFISSLLLVAGLLPFTICTAQAPLLYGVTLRGGVNGLGAIIKFNPANDSESVAWSFGSGTDGQSPYAALTFDAYNGLLYGTTYTGGTDSLGTIISFDPLNDSEKVVWNFGAGMDGVNPIGLLTYNAANGLYYGMTYDGGDNGFGVIFTFNPLTDSENVVWSFGAGQDGQHPEGALLYDAATGLYYGTTSDGGTTGYGTIFSFNASTNKDSVIWNFGNGYDGAGPGGNLSYDATTGLLYTTTQYGGTKNDGAIVSFNTTTNKDSVLWNFGTGTDGKYPFKGLTYNVANQLFYATTNTGGTKGDGAIISFNPADDSESVVWSFGQGADGQGPQSDIIYDSANNLYYGTTYGGGSNFAGVIYSFNPANDSETVVWNFGAGTDGASPKTHLTFYAPGTCLCGGIKTPGNALSLINIFPNPSTSTFNFANLPNQCTIEIYNVLGQQVYSSPAVNSTYQLNMSSQAKGIYFYRVIANASVVGDGKMVLE